MHKKLTSISALVLCFLMIFTFASCGGTESDGENETAFDAANVSVDGGIPASEAQIVEFFNKTVSYVQDNANFTAENKPGVKTNESISAKSVKVLAYDKTTGEASESDSLKSLNKSANAIKDRIISGIDTSVPVIGFGDMNASASTVMYPYDSAESALAVEDVKSATCSVNGTSMNIEIVLNAADDSIVKIFGSREKEAVIKAINEGSDGYAEVSDYSVDYIADEESNTYSTISLSVEVEKQDNGSYVCTGRIISLKYRIISDVSANVDCTGSFADYGSVQVNFRFTDEKSYEFDWYNAANWEPVKS